MFALALAALLAYVQPGNGTYGTYATYGGAAPGTAIVARAEVSYYAEAGYAHLARSEYCLSAVEGPTPRPVYLCGQDRAGLLVGRQRVIVYDGRAYCGIGLVGGGVLVDGVEGIDGTLWPVDGAVAR